MFLFLCILAACFDIVGRDKTGLVTRLALHKKPLILSVEHEQNFVLHHGDFTGSSSSIVVYSLYDRCMVGLLGVIRQGPDIGRTGMSIPVQHMLLEQGQRGYRRPGMSL